MRCPSCGSENLSASGLCHKCGKPLNPLRATTGQGTARTSIGPATAALRSDPKTSISYVDHRDIPHRLKFEYSHTLKDHTQKALESIQELLEHFTRSVMNIEDLMQQVADNIRKQFGIDNVAIGIKSPQDGKYRYVVLSGLREDAAKSHMNLVYTINEFYKDGDFNGTFISKYSKIFLAEDNEYKDVEKVAYNRPLLLGLKRRALTDALEADYVDSFILGPDDELLGWIEISGTRTGKLPDAVTIRWVETAAAIIGAAMRCEKHRRDS